MLDEGGTIGVVISPRFPCPGRYSRYVSHPRLPCSPIQSPMRLSTQSGIPFNEPLTNLLSLPRADCWRCLLPILLRLWLLLRGSRFGRLVEPSPLG